MHYYNSDKLIKVLLFVLGVIVLLGGNIRGFSAVLFSIGLLLYLRCRGVGGLGSGSEHPCSQYEVTLPLPLSSTSPLRSRLKVPYLSKIFLVASDTWILRAEVDQRARQEVGNKFLTIRIMSVRYKDSRSPEDSILEAVFTVSPNRQ